MRIQDIMTARVVSIPPDASAGTAREALRLHGIQHLVVMSNKKIVGVLSDRDLTGRADDLKVSTIMRRDVPTIEPDATLRHAAGVMDGRTVECLPVVDGGSLKGIVTTSDLLRALAKGSAHPEATPPRAVLRKRAPRKRHVAM